MPKSKLITSVFSYATPIGAGQIGERSFVDRAGSKEKLLSAVQRDGLLLVSGYSSIGKTTLIQLATTKAELRRAGMPFRAVISVLADHLLEGGVLKGIYNELTRDISGPAPSNLTPATIAQSIQSSQLLLVIDGVNSLYGDRVASKDMFNLCKAWTDLPRIAAVQSKIVLVASGLSREASLWLSEAGAGKRLPREHIEVEPWSSQDLRRIIEVGSRRLGVSFDSDLQTWMAKVACGLPATMTLLAALACQHANGGRDGIVENNALSVELTNLRGVFGESNKFRDILYYNDRLNDLSITDLLALFLLGTNGGVMPENKLRQYIEQCGFVPDSISPELAELVTTDEQLGEPLWCIRELSYGTFAFLRLYYRSKLGTSDAEHIAQALDQVIELEAPFGYPNSADPKRPGAMERPGRGNGGTRVEEIYVDFDLYIAPDGHAIASSLEGQASAEISPQPPEDVQSALKLIEQRQTDADLLRRMGESLYNWLFPAPIHTHFQQTEAAARHNDAKLRVRMRVEADKIASLPLEFLYRSIGGYFLAINPDTVLSRYLNLPMPESRVRRREGPLHMLAIIADPSDQVRLPPDEWKAILDEALAKPRNEGLLTLTTVTRATREEITNALLQQKPDIVQFIGHGIYKDNKGYVALVNGQTGKTWRVDDDAFSRLFMGYDDNLGLISLATCESAKTDNPQGFLGIAPKLVQRGGLPAVIAMQYKVYIRTAKVFLKDLYTYVAARKPVDWAVQQARNSISLEFDLNNREFATPVLYMRAADGNVF